MPAFAWLNIPVAIFWFEYQCKGREHNEVLALQSHLESWYVHLASQLHRHIIFQLLPHFTFKLYCLLRVMYSNYVKYNNQCEEQLTYWLCLHCAQLFLLFVLFWSDSRVMETWHSTGGAACGPQYKQTCVNANHANRKMKPFEHVVYTNMWKQPEKREKEKCLVKLMVHSIYLQSKTLQHKWHLIPVGLNPVASQKRWTVLSFALFANTSI